MFTESELKNTENRDILPVYKYSPTCYHTGMKTELANKKQFCRISDIRKMIERGQLVENDIVILKVLLKYGFLSRYTLSQLISQMCEDVPKRANYKNALAKLVKNGLLLRYYMTWEDGGTSHSSPCFYTLSNGAREYVKKVYALNEPDAILRMSAKKELDAVVLAKTATINQYHAIMMQNYRERILQTYLWFDIATDKASYCVPCIHRYKTHIFGSGHLDIICIPVRTNAGYKEEVVACMENIQTYIKTSAAVFDNPFYILLCENGEHAHQLNLFLMDSKFKNASYLYLLDRNIVNDAPLDFLFCVQENESGYSLEIQRLHIH